MPLAAVSKRRSDGGPLRIAAIAVATAGALTPVLFGGGAALDTAARVAVFVVLAASYDLVVGYARLVSFAHAMFFGIGATSVAMASIHLTPGFAALALGTLGGAIVSAGLSGLVGILALRAQPAVFALTTFVFASAAALAASQFAGLAGSTDGLTVAVPAELTPQYDIGTFPAVPGQAVSDNVDAVAALAGPGGQTIDGRVLTYYGLLATAIVAVLVLRRLAGGTLGATRRAARDVPAMTEDTGVTLFTYRLAATVIAAVLASVAGAMYALWFRAVDMQAVFGLDVMILILLMVLIGGMGTIWGSVIGAALVGLAQVHLPGLAAQAATAAAAAGLPILPDLLASDRWPFWVGLLLILGAGVAPLGIAGLLGRSR